MLQKSDALLKWLLFFALTVIWGSAFILMKEGMRALDAYQVASIRMVSAGIVLLPVGIKNFRVIPNNKIGWIFLSGMLGNFIPAFLFCIAETRITSSLAGFLNAITPILIVVTGILIFRNKFPAHKIFGVLIGFTGMAILFFMGSGSNMQDFKYSMFVILATLSYALNVNMVARYLKDVASLNIAAVAFTMLLIPSLVVLFVTGYFSFPLNEPEVVKATAASSLLGISSTAIASVLFYMLLKKAGPLFSSLVTYAIPFVALFWGVLAGEVISLWEVVGLGVILAGVYLSNK
jgi:drug/metabolite transporter (DMT)-like permease